MVGAWRWTLAIPALIAATSGCQAGSDPALTVSYSDAEVRHSSLRPVLIRGRPVSSSEILARPFRLHVLDDTTLAVIDAVDPFVHLVDRRTGRVTRSIGRAGLGPGEVQGVRAVLVEVAWRHGLWLYELERGLLVFATSEGTQDSTISVREMGMIDALAWLDDSTVIGLSVGVASHRTPTRPSETWPALRGLATLSVRSGNVTRVGEPLSLPDSGLGELNARTRLQIHQETRGCFERSRAQFVRINRNMSSGDIIGVDGAVVADLATPFSFRPHLRPPGLFDVGDANQRVAYIACSTTPKRIVALFSGRRVGSFAPSESYLGTFLHVFTWRGELDRVVQLDRAVRTLAVDTVTGEIFAITEGPEPAVVAYDLSQIVR